MLSAPRKNFYLEIRNPRNHSKSAREARLAPPAEYVWTEVTAWYVLLKSGGPDADYTGVTSKWARDWAHKRWQMLADGRRATAEI